jgi:hypothetical protein
VFYCGVQHPASLKISPNEQFVHPSTFQITVNVLHSEILLHSRVDVRDCGAVVAKAL